MVGVGLSCHYRNSSKQAPVEVVAQVGKGREGGRGIGRSTVGQAKRALASCAIIDLCAREAGGGARWSKVGRSEKER